MDPQEYENRETSPNVVDTDEELLHEEPQPNNRDISSPDGSIYEPRTTRSTPTRKLRKRARSSISQAPSDDEKEDSDTGLYGPYTDERIRQDALDWAARFKEPDHGEVKSPTRKPPGSRAIKRKVVVPSKSRAKRLKGYYSNEYKYVVNIDIRDAVRRITNEEQVFGESSQIGISVWTSQEKDMFFASLSRLGRDDVHGISQRIGTKSELEVQEYVQLLHEALVERDDLQHQFHVTDVPAALEVSEECCAVLERAGDALTSRLEQYEEESEQAKWGEEWLLTPDACKWISKKRNEDGGEDALEEILPAANLFNLKTWLALSERIFMNPAAPKEEDNWQTLAEPGEQPSIRATAFGDFHSLAIHTTKKLVSTVLFCTMSKLRSMDSSKTKHAEISVADVEAAVKILNFPANSKEYWAKCARRCNLEVFAESLPQEGEDDICLTYDDVESALSGTISHSESELRQENGRESEDVVPNDEIYTDTDASEFEAGSDLEDDEPNAEGHREEDQEDQEDQDLDLDDDNETDAITDISESEPLTYYSRTERSLKLRKARKAYELAQDIYTEEFDNKANQAEERNLWTLLRQGSPFEVKSEVELPELPKTSTRNIVSSFVDWRVNTEYRSEWESLDRPVPEEKFLRLSKEEKELRVRTRRTRGNIGGRKGDLVGTSDSESGEDGTNHDSAEDSDDATSHVSISSGMASPYKYVPAPERFPVDPSIKSESGSEYEEGM